MHKFAAIIAGIAVLASPYIKASTPDFVGDYIKRAKQLPSEVLSAVAADSLTNDERMAMMMLYAYMPQSDVVNRTPQFYLTQAVRPALTARATTAWGHKVPDLLFYHYVLPLRVNNEALDAHRTSFFEELLPRIAHLDSMQSVILEINHWCHEKASYRPSDGRTHSPLQTISSAIGRCGEESTFAVAALRAAGIPARQVYTPRWAHTDDNHAWVEAWADGQWHFLGACEPEPVLDLAWFNQPASRGMLMHARTFGRYSGPGEVLARQNGNTDLNVTANYAPTDTVTVLVTDAVGCPVESAEVSFRIYNYAEYYPIATKYTDSNGRATLIAGHGDLLVWARTQQNGQAAMALSKADKSTRNITLSLSASPLANCNFTITPPPDKGACTPPVTAAQAALNAERLRLEDSVRMAYIATWPDSARTKEIASALQLPYHDLWPLITDARGNHAVIIDFLTETPPIRRPLAMALLKSLTAKDLSDIPTEVLRDALQHAPSPYPSHPEADYGTSQLSPRIGLEELTPYRQFFEETFPSETRKAFNETPAAWVDWVRSNIADTLQWYPEQATMCPQGVYTKRSASPLSRDIFFVAGARSFGIPARLDPITSIPQYFHSGKWNDVLFAQKTGSDTDDTRGYLMLTYSPEGNSSITDPKYYTHFTISKIVDGAPSLLSYPDFCSVSEQFSTPAPLSAGRYMLTSGRRLADGSVLSRLLFFDIAPSDTTHVQLTIDADTTQLQVIGTLDAEILYLPENASAEQSLLSTAGRGYYVLGLLDPDTEPSHHAVNDLCAAADELDSLSRCIFLIYRNDTDIPKINPQLPRGVVRGSDPDGKIEQTLFDGLYIDASPAMRPVFIVADSFGRIVYLCQGYQIGLGTRLVEILRSLQP